MNRKLLILNVALGAGVMIGGYGLYEQMQAAKLRLAGMPGPPVKSGAAPMVTPMGQKPAVVAGGYKEIADKLLFDASRNPNIPVDPVIPPAPLPPPVPPPLPSLHGIMDLGDGPFAMMTESGETHYQEVHKGGTIGPFKLLSFNRQEFEVEWEGKVIHRRVDEQDQGRNRPAGAAAASTSPMPLQGIIPGIAAQPQAPVQPSTADLGPGPQLTDQFRACKAGDGAPAGTVSDGYQKQLKGTPLGISSCLWVAVGK